MTDPTGITHYRFRLKNGLIGTAIFDHSATSYAIDFDLGVRRSLSGDYNCPTLCFSREAAAVDDHERMRRVLRASGVRYHEKWVLEEMTVPSAPPGTYYPRIWRQTSGPAPRETYGPSFTGNLVAYWNLERDLQGVLKTLEPDPHNDKAYGHQIRNLLILACTEVEQLLKQVLRDNGYSVHARPEPS